MAAIVYSYHCFGLFMGVSNATNIPGRPTLQEYQGFPHYCWWKKKNHGFPLDFTLNCIRYLHLSRFPKMGVLYPPIIQFHGIFHGINHPILWKHPNMFHLFPSIFNGNSRILKWRYLPYIRPMQGLCKEIFRQFLWPTKMAKNVPPC